MSFFTLSAGGFDVTDPVKVRRKDGSRSSLATGNTRTVVASDDWTNFSPHAKTLEQFRCD